MMREDAVDARMVVLFSVLGLMTACVFECVWREMVGGGSTKSILAVGDCR